MKFLHMADVHLGCIPDSQSPWADERSKEIWDTFRNTLEDASKAGTELVLIAGDLFHHPPTEQELREVSYFFSLYPEMCFVLTAGNHDFDGPDSAWKRAEFPENTAFLGGETLRCVRIDELQCEVYGLSYTRPEIRENLYRDAKPVDSDYFHILLAHGGDETHCPFTADDLRKLKFDYIALGHIHKPTVLIKDRAIYPGALTPIDSADEGPHGFILGQTHGHHVRTSFVRKAPREYVTLPLEVNERDTLFSVHDRLSAAIKARGENNIYKVELNGKRDPSVRFDPSFFADAGRILSLSDHTVLSYDLDALRERYYGSLIQRYIDSFEEDPDSSETDQLALQYGLESLLSHSK